MIRSRVVGLGFLAAVVLLTAPANAQQMTLQRLLELNAAAMGGRARLDLLRSVVTLRTFTSLTSMKLPHFVLVEGFDTTGHVRYSEGYDGRVAWEQTSSDSIRRVVTGRAVTALRRVAQWPNNVRALYNVTAYGGRLELEGVEEREGVGYYRVRLTLPDGFERWYFVHPTTYRLALARDTRELHANDGNTRMIETVFGDYRQVEGYWFPFTVYERDARTGERLFGRTVLAIFPNEAIPDSLFSPATRSSLERVLAYRSRLQPR